MPGTKYVNKVIYGGRTLIDLTGDTISADKLLTGITAHDKSGAPITGSCPFDVDSTDATAAVAEERPVSPPQRRRSLSPTTSGRASPSWASLVRCRAPRI